MFEHATGWAPIETLEKQSDGTLIVSGPVADSGLDRDLQILDGKWLADAVPQWMAEGGNIRAQHRADSASGVALELADGHRVAARIVDPVDVLKCETGVYKGFSVGIKRPKIVQDAAAPGGRVVGGQIIEVSLVDRPCNPRTLLTVAKADGANDDAELELIEAPERVEKTEEVEQMTPDQVRELIKAELPAIVADAVKAAIPPAPAVEKTEATPEFLTKADAEALLTGESMCDAVTAAVTKALEPLKLDEIGERLAKVEAQPAAGGPVITGTASAGTSPAADTRAYFTAKADAADRDGQLILAEGYRQMAANLPA